MHLPIGAVINLYISYCALFDLSNDFQISLLDLKMNRKKGVANKSKPKGPPKCGIWRILLRAVKSIGSAMVFTVLFGIVLSSLSMHIISAAWVYICLNQYVPLKKMSIIILRLVS